VEEDGLSSKSILDAGEKSSSNCPVLTPHRNATRNMAATEILAINSTMMTLISLKLNNCCKSIFLSPGSV
jgi:hypothetical protein